MVGFAGHFSLLGVGRISGHYILELLQNTNDLAATCANFHHLDNSGQSGRSWLSRDTVYSFTHLNHLDILS